MSTMADDHTEKGVKGVQIAGTSMYDSEAQLDDDCISENSYGSDFGDNAMNEGNIPVTVDIEVDSSLPTYSDEEHRQPDDMYVRSPNGDLTLEPHYTLPTRSTRPTLNAKFSGPSMCVVGGLIFTPSTDIDQLIC